MPIGLTRPRVHIVTCLPNQWGDGPRGFASEHRMDPKLSTNALLWWPEP